MREYQGYLIRAFTVRRVSLVAQKVKNLHAMQEVQVQSLGQEDPLEKGMATHSSILVCLFLLFIYSPIILLLLLFFLVFLPEEFQRQRSLVICSLWGHKELDTTQQLRNLNKLSVAKKNLKQNKNGSMYRNSCAPPQNP